MHRDKGRCRRCGKLERGEAHHIVSRNVTATRWMLSNGVYLCRVCHAAVHATDREWGKTEELMEASKKLVKKRELAERAVEFLKKVLASGNFSDELDV